MSNIRFRTLKTRSKDDLFKRELLFLIKTVTPQCGYLWPTLKAFEFSKVREGTSSAHQEKSFSLLSLDNFIFTGRMCD